MKTNNELIEATKLVLLYSRLDGKIAGSYLKLIEHVASKFNISNAKSFRFESDFSKIATVKTPSFREIRFPMPGKEDTEVLAIEYYIRAETAPRYAFFAKDLVESFSVRFFGDFAKYNRFIHNHKITTVREMEFHGSKFAEYTSEGSNVKRFAMCAGAEDITLKDFAEHINKTETTKPITADVNHTSYFA